jgi:hypothetical protein
MYNVMEADFPTSSNQAKPRPDAVQQQQQQQQQNHTTCFPFPFPSCRPSSKNSSFCTVLCYLQSCFAHVKGPFFCMPAAQTLDTSSNSNLLPPPLRLDIHLWHSHLVFIMSRPANSPSRKKVAIVGSGCTGIAALWALNRTYHDVYLYEANDRLGGHTNTVQWKTGKYSTAVDTGFIVLNSATYRKWPHAQLRLSAMP